MLKYSLPINATFGWAPVYHDMLKDVLFNGQLCKTGLAVPFNGTLIGDLAQNNSQHTRMVGLCVNVTSVKTDQKLYSDFTYEAPKCVAANKGSMCYYNYQYNDKDYNFRLRCACSSDGSIGYCPLPNLQTLRDHSLNDLFIQGNSTNCHTQDRYNIKA